MEILSGRRLTIVAVVLGVSALAAALGVAVTGDPRLPPATGVRQGVAPTPDPARVSAEIALAKDAEEAGNVGAALVHYRAAALLDPRIVDPRSPLFLGPGFEARLKKWVAGQGTGGKGGDQARSDAAYLFRRMYGGCG